MKKKVALSATAIAVLASTVPTPVAPVEAAGKEIYVSYDMGGSNLVGGGDGTLERPYNQLREAVENAQNGDTIIIIGNGTIADVTNNAAPWVIDKELTIKSNDGMPPVIDIRAGGIVLGANVKFENVVLNLANGACNDIFANGHKLELYNVVTVGSSIKDIDIYAGSLATDSTATSKAGTLGHVLIKTDGNFKEPQYGTKVTKLGAIYAGSSGGESNIESLIEVNTPYSDSTVSIGTIYGAGSSNQSNNKDVNIKLDGLAFPVVDGYTGSSAKTNVEVINQSASGRSFNCVNIDKLTLTKGEIQLRNSQLDYIPTVDLTSGTTLNLKNVAPEVTIDNYIGQGVVIIPKTGLLNITNGVTDSNSLKLAVDFHFSGASDPATENHVYAITPKGSKIDFTPANSQSAYELYPFEEGTELQWKFIQSINRPQPEPDTELPSITEFTVTEGEGTQTVNLSDYTDNPAHEVIYNIGVSTDSGDEDEEVWLTDYEDDLVVTVNGQPAKRVDSDGTITYYNEEDNVDIYLEPGSDPRTQQVRVSFRDADGNYTEPEKSKYEIEIGTEDVSPVKLTLTVEGLEGGEEEEQPTKPALKGFIVQESERTKDFYKSAFKSHDDPTTLFTFKLDTEEGQVVSLSDYYDDLKVTINGDTTERITQDGDDHLYFNSPFEMMKVYFEPGEGVNEYNLVLLSYQGGDPAVPQKPVNEIEVSYLGGKPLVLTANVVPDEQLPPKEEEEEQTKVPTIKSFSISDKEATKVLEVGENELPIAEFLSYTFNAEIENAEVDSLVGFEGLTLTYDGTELELVRDNEGKPAYRIPNHTTLVYLDKEGTDGTYKLRLVSTKQDETIQNPSFDTHTIKVSHKDVKQPLVLTFELKQKEQTPPPTPPAPKPEEEEKELKVTDVSFPNGSTKTVDSSKAGLEIKFPFNMTLEGKDSGTVLFKDLGYIVTINGKEAKLSGTNYVLEESKLYLGVTNSGSGNFEAALYTVNERDMNVPLAVGDYNIKATGPVDFEFSIVVKDTTPDNKEEEKEEPTPPTTDPDDKEEEKPSGGTTPPSTSGSSTGGSTSGGSSTGGSTGGGTTTEPTTPPSGSNKPSSGNTGGGTVTPPPSQEETKPSTPPSTDEGKEPTSPTPPLVTVPNGVDNIENIRKEMQEKVDSLLTDISIQENGTIIDLVGDDDDLSNVSSLEVTKEGLFINVDGEKVKFNTELDLSNIDWDNTRIIRVGGGPVPHKQNGEGFTITTSNFNNLLITAKEPEPFDDVNEDDWFHGYVEDAYNLGVTTGTTATTFDPNDPITRAQAASMLARAYELEPTGEGNILSDVDGKWYADDVQALTDAGIIKGFPDGTFRGDELITRQQLAMLLTRTIESKNPEVKSSVDFSEAHFKDSRDISEEAKPALRMLANTGVINSGEDTSFRPAGHATRAQMVKMMVVSAPLSGLY